MVFPGLNPFFIVSFMELFFNYKNNIDLKIQDKELIFKIVCARVSSMCVIVFWIIPILSLFVYLLGLTDSIFRSDYLIDMFSSILD